MKGTIYPDFFRYGILVNFKIFSLNIHLSKKILEFQKLSVGICERCGTIPHSFRHLLKDMLWDTIWWINVVKANICICKQVLLFYEAHICAEYLILSLVLSSLMLKEGWKWIHYSYEKPSQVWPLSNPDCGRPLCLKYWNVTNFECWWYPCLHFTTGILACAFVVFIHIMKPSQIIELGYFWMRSN